MSNRHNSIVTSNRMDGGSSSVSRSVLFITSPQAVRDQPPPSQFKMYENTYQLGPKTPASSSRLQKIIVETLNEILVGKTYSSESNRLAKVIADQLKQKAKELGMPRYKHICLVALGPSKQSTLSMSSRCVWDPSVDTYAEHTYEKDGLFATALIYSVYTE